MEQESYSSGEERVYVSTLPVDRWVKLAIGKLSKGYMLIVGERNAQFFQRGRGYEPCPMPVAKMLVKEGLVTEKGTNEKGTIYHLAGDGARVWTYVPPVKARDEEDEDELLGAEEDETIDVGDTDDGDDEDEVDEGEPDDEAEDGDQLDEEED